MQPGHAKVRCVEEHHTPPHPRVWGGLAGPRWGWPESVPPTGHLLGQRAGVLSLALPAWGIGVHPLPGVWRGDRPPTYSTFPNKMSRVPVSLLADPMQSGLGSSSLSGINSTSLVTLSVKSLPSMRETQVQSLGREDPLEKKMDTHSSILAWRIPWTEEPDGLRSMGSPRVGHD